MTPNTGRMPPRMAGKRVRGKLRNGSPFGYEPVTTVTPAGWSADGKMGCRWTLIGSEFDIHEWEEAK